MLAMLSEKGPRKSGDAERFEAQIYHVLGAMSNLAIAGETLEQTLLKTLEKKAERRWGALPRKSQAADPCVEPSAALSVTSARCIA